MLLGLTIYLALLLVSLLTLKKLKMYLKLARIPGPLLPQGIKGSIPEFVAAPRKVGPEFSKTYGPVYRMFTANFEPLVAIADPVVAKKLYSSQANMPHSWDLGMGHFFHRYIGLSMGFARDKKWSQHRRTFRTSLSAVSADASLGNMSVSLEDWDKTVLEPLAKSGEAIAISDLVGLMPMTLMLKIFFGSDFINRKSSEVRELSHDADSIMSTVIHDKTAALFFYKYMDTEANRTLKRFKTSWYKLLSDYEKSPERNSGKGGSYDKVIQTFNNTEASSETLTSVEVAETMAEIIFANQDVLHPAAVWLISDLVTYPEVTQALAFTSHEMLDKNAVESHPVLNVIKESSRVHPFFPISLPEVTYKDLDLGDGCVLPAGVKVSIDQYALNHNPNYWTDPDKFQPSRFNNLDDLVSQWGAFRFGFGGRRCPGQHYGNLVLANTVSKLLSKYELRPVRGHFPKRHQDVPLAGPGRVTTLPDLKVCLVPRGQSQKPISRQHIIENINDNNNNISSFKQDGSIQPMTESGTDGSFSPNSIIQPIFLNENNVQSLASTNVMVGVSVLPKSPLLNMEGSTSLVQFLASLPNQSLIFLVDRLNSHNIRAMAKLNRSGTTPTISDQKAVATALKEGDKYHKVLAKAISQLASCKSHKVKLARWNDVEDNVMKAQQETLHRHYRTTNLFRAKIDQIALDFLQMRRPKCLSKQSQEARLPHMKNYLIEELPVMLSGIVHQGTHYQTLAYPTEASKAQQGQCMANDVFYLAHQLMTHPQFDNIKRDLLEISAREATPGVTLLPISEESSIAKGEEEESKQMTQKTFEVSSKIQQQTRDIRTFLRQMSSG